MYYLEYRVLDDNVLFGVPGFRRKYIDAKHKE